MCSSGWFPSAVSRFLVMREDTEGIDSSASTSGEASVPQCTESLLHKFIVYLKFMHYVSVMDGSQAESSSVVCPSDPDVNIGEDITDTSSLESTLNTSTPSNRKKVDRSLKKGTWLEMI
ncbi:hypothetical protein Zmor_023677 [Zophobas morio]|uniref:Uncharacterized protein n=1 Tax=Zophobas morio TaxID=2755281 RepID=A0AA38HYP1_9CUCU|nr:hypothetical protein Zmor_023677 [Zophobas morio]